MTERGGGARSDETRRRARGAPVRAVTHRPRASRPPACKRCPRRIDRRFTVRERILLIVARAFLPTMDFPGSSLVSSARGASGVARGSRALLRARRRSSSRMPAHVTPRRVETRLDAGASFGRLPLVRANPYDRGRVGTLGSRVGGRSRRPRAPRRSPAPPPPFSRPPHAQASSRATLARSTRAFSRCAATSSRSGPASPPRA